MLSTVSLVINAGDEMRSLPVNGRTENAVTFFSSQNSNKLVSKNDCQDVSNVLIHSLIYVGLLL